MKPFKTVLEAQLGVTGQLVVGGDADDMGKRLKEDDVQLAVFHGVELAWARQKHPGLKPLLIAVNQKRFLRAVVVVRGDSKAAALSDLQGQALALPKRSREHCRLFVERRCVAPGSTPEKFYSQVTAPRDHVDAIDDVIDGAAAAAVLDEVDLEAYRRDYPERAQKVRALAESERFPCAAIAYVPGALDEGQVERFKSGLIDSRGNKSMQSLLKLARITGFEAVPEGYEQMLDEVAKAYPAPAK
jgi:ABC-type phosphate/phosphonate transport system substrate-binding protein